MTDESWECHQCGSVFSELTVTCYVCYPSTKPINQYKKVHVTTIKYIETVPHPDLHALQQFKESVQKYIKKGYKADGKMRTEANGKLVQKMVKKTIDR